MKSETLSVEIDPETIIMSDSGSVTGVIFFVSNYGSFPENNWNDFPVVILTWWAISLSDFNARNIKLKFMDGPYYLKIEPRINGRTLCTFIKENLKNEVIYEIKINLDDFIKSVLAAINGVLRKCYECDYNSKDIDQLSYAFKKLQSQRKTEIKGTPIT